MINEAQKRGEGLVLETPIHRSNSFGSLTGREVYLKAECLQRTGSFKVRGAHNAISRLGGAPVVAASAGNHAQGVALAAQWSNSPATVFMPETAPLPKVNATSDYGADVQLVGRNLATAVLAAEEFAEEKGAHFIHPYDDPYIIAGQGTLGLEVCHQLPEAGTVIIPTGGGGLLAGTALAVKSQLPQSRIVGVEVEPAAMYEPYRRTGVLEPASNEGTTICDGIDVRVPSQIAHQLIEEHVDDLVVVRDNQTTSALTLILERAKLIVEPSGCVGIAALMENLIPAAAPEPIVVVLSGGNIDLLLLGKMVRTGMESSGRYAELRIWIPDQPGQLARILEIVGEHGANVVSVEHHREGFGLPFGTVEIDIAVETRGAKHAVKLRSALADEFDLR
ncbi:MAG: threonine ammonia-lyase [Acidimicrobiia bacterium]|nr:threonine ammonia-lyase [Acidimicrobiia bacterium]